MTTTTQDDGFHEIQLNGKQLVFLFMAGTVVAVVIFLLGVFVGRGVRGEGGDARSIVAAEAGPDVEPAIPPAGATSGPALSSEIVTYPESLAATAAPKETLRESAPASPTAPPAVKAPTTTAPSAASRDVAVEPSGNGFAIQLAALAKREEAEGIVRRLTAKGYAAYLMAPAAGAPAVYRVRVGKFKDRREAETVSNRLQKEEQFKPWIVR